MTYVGGERVDNGADIAILDSDRLVICGDTVSADLVGRTDEIRPGFADAFVCEVSTDGQVRWSSFIGGTDIDWTTGLLDDADCDSIVIFGQTLSTDFEGAINQSYAPRDFDGYLAHVTLPPLSNPQLTIRAICPKGGPAEIQWSEAAPGGRIAIAHSADLGISTVPRLRICSGTTLDLDPMALRLGLMRQSEADGGGLIRTSIVPSICGSYLQLLDLTTCTTSNVARIE